MKFGITGVGGYIAPRHLKAIRECGGDLVCALDPVDSVGILDRDFSDVEFFMDEAEFEAHLKKNPVDYLSICSPNFKHKDHILMGLRAGCNVMCEKPLVLTLEDLEEVKEAEKASGKTVATILQLRVHPSIRALRDQILAERENNRDKTYNVDLSYITSRGPWFHKSWKGDVAKSGGLPTNIGVHFFDMLSWLFGDIQNSELHRGNPHVFAGFMQFERANVRWFLSVDRKFLPEKAIKEGKTTYRSITLDGDEIEFSTGFTDLHTVVYQEFLRGHSYGTDAVKVGISVVENLRKMQETGPNQNSHPFLK